MSKRNLNECGLGAHVGRQGGERGRSKLALMARGACALSVVAGCLLMTRPARADLELGADLEGVYSLDGDRSAGGGGFGVRLGNRFALPLVVMAVELKGGFYGYGGDRNSKVYTGLAGARIGVGEVIRPSLFAHVGIGHVTHDDLPGAPAPNRTGFTADGGVALDFTLLPLLDIGVHGSYGVITNADFDWILGGLHATLVF